MDKGLIVHTVIYNDDQKVLIVKRSKANDVLSEFWDIPGGTLEDGEDPAAGATREAREETGLDIADLRLFFEHSNVDSTKNKQFVTLVFAARYPGGEITLNPGEHEEYVWIDPAEIGKYKTVDYLEKCLGSFFRTIFMSEHKEFVVRCRGIILHDNKLLVVRHPSDTSYAALPGGHLEWGEDVKSCISREIVEELGVKPVIGRLLYINNFSNGDGVPSVEFFFEVANGADYVGCEKLARSHAFELAEIHWAGSADDIKILPKRIGKDLRAGTILSDEVRYIS